MLSHLVVVVVVVATFCYPTIALANQLAVFAEQLATSASQSLSTAVSEPEPTNEGWIDPRINGGQFLDVSPTISMNGLKMNVWNSSRQRLKANR